MEERPIWQIVSEEFACEHESTELRRRTKSNGVQCWVHQCIRCGDRVGVEVKRELVPLGRRSNPIDFDDHLRNQWYSRRQGRLDELRQREEDLRANRQTQWWKQYNAYLESPAWKYLRQQVLRRDNYVCQGCHQNHATQVHHLTYERQGRELMFDLVSVCDDCHARCHDKETEE